MRYLHAVGPQERFVASGTYTYYRSEKPTGLIEHWTIHEQPDGAQFVRVDVDGREADRSSILIEAWRSPDEEGRAIERFDLHAFAPKDSPVKEIRATYTLFDDYVEVGISVGKSARQYQEVRLSPDYVVHAGSGVLLGYAVDRTALHNGEETCVLSYIPRFEDENAFQPYTYKQTVALKASETLDIGRKAYPARRYERRVLDTEEISIVWLDGYNILLREGAFGAEEYVILTEYARRPDPK